MATTAAPSRTVERPNIPSAAVRFPAIKDYEQVDREIAGTLYLSPHTVKEHTSSLYRKLNVRNRAEAVQKAQRLGLIS